MQPLAHREDKEGKTVAVFAREILGAEWLWDYGTKVATEFPSWEDPEG